MDPNVLLNQAVEQHKSGNLSEAETLYKRALKKGGKNFPAHYMYAVLQYQQEQYTQALRTVELALKLNPSAVEALSLHSVLSLKVGQYDKALASVTKVVQQNPKNPEALHNRGVILTDLQRFDEAIDSFDQALALRPTAEAWINRGVALHKQSRLNESLRSFEEALALNPAVTGALYNYGNVLSDMERFEDAVTVFDKMLVQVPESFEAWTNRGAALQSLGRLQESRESYDKALGLRRDFAPAWTNRGKILQELELFSEALADYEQALALDPKNLGALHARATTNRSLGELDEALNSVDRILAIEPDNLSAQILRGWLLCENQRIADGLRVFRDATKPTIKLQNITREPIPAHKQRHDAEQHAYLLEQGITVKECELYIADGHRLDTPAINSANAGAAIQQWKKSQPRMVVVDNLLTPEALASLQRYCWGSTMWQRSYDSGYLGAMPEQGFASPLLAQIAEELRTIYPEIIGDHGLRMLWGFKYDSRLEGIKIHADQAAINVNFWITPDSANLNPESGGMVIWDKAAPKDWDPVKYNGNEAAMREFLVQTGAKPITVPYRANRAVIFDSDLFHETDSIDFKEGYVNRRINITMLYGRRTTTGR